MIRHTLMYHELFPQHDKGYLSRTGLPTPSKERYALSAERFTRHLKAIAAVADVGIYRGDSPTSMDPGTVLVTLDDGGLSGFELARPLLESRGWRGHFFVCTDLIGRPGFMTRKQVVELAHSGHYIGSHCRSHRILTTLDDTSLVEEVVGSKQDLENLLGHPCEALAIPGGIRDGRVMAHVRRAGYSVVFLSTPPRKTVLDSSGLCMIGRWAVHAGTSADEIRDMLMASPFRILAARTRASLLATMRRGLGMKRYMWLRSRIRH